MGLLIVGFSVNSLPKDRKRYTYYAMGYRAPSVRALRNFRYQPYSCMHPVGKFQEISLATWWTANGVFQGGSDQALASSHLNDS